MVHLSLERLADLALDPTEKPDTGELDHLTACTSCQPELDALRQVVRAAQAPVEVLETPPERVWAGLRTAISAADGNRTEPLDRHQRSAAPSRPMTPRRQDRARPGSRLPVLAAVAALVVGLALGAFGANTIIRQRSDRPQLLASTELVALPGKTGHGTARLIVANGVPQVQVELAAPGPATDFREVWLIDSTDHTRMYSLGDLDDSGTGTFTLPPGLDGRLGGYTVVDISDEPYDGNSAHSGRSIVRGSLPN